MTGSRSLHIDRLQRQAAQASGLVSFAGALPDPRLFPKRSLGAAFVDALQAEPNALQYGWPEGLPDLRSWVANHLSERGARIDPEHVLITNGAQQALSLVSRWTAHGAKVGVPRECYPGALDCFRSRGLEPTSQRGPVAGLYAMPAIANPSGQAMTELERSELLARAHRSDAWILEDDAYAELRFDGVVAAPLLAEAAERVFHVGTFSKVLCPGLRVGWLASKHPGLRELAELKRQDDLEASSLTQRILLEYLRGSSWTAHLTKIRKAYARKARLLRESVLRALPDFQVREARGGFSLWLELREDQNSCAELDFLRRAIEGGVSFDPGSSFRSERNPRLALRLCFSSVDGEDIETGIERLAKVWRSMPPVAQRRAG